VEDNKQISGNIQEYLQDEFQVQAVYNGANAVDLIRASEYDIVILDLMLPEVDGMTVLSFIKTSYINTGVIILTAIEELDEKMKAFNIGANDYLTKPFFLEELKARMYEILRSLGKISAQNNLVLRNLTMNIKAKSVIINMGCKKVELDLSQKLYSLLEYLLLNKGILLFKEQIFDRICGYNSEATEQIVEVYISQLRKKLSEFDLDKYIVTKRGVGYRLDENASDTK
jgi:two-component system response regulator CiaR